MRDTFENCAATACAARSAMPRPCSTKAASSSPAPTQRWPTPCANTAGARRSSSAGRHSCGGQALLRRTRFVVFGHALYDQMRAPFHGLCGKALYVTMSDEAIGDPAFLGNLDARFATSLDDPGFLATPAALHPMPLLGIPGVTPDSEDPAYYDDVSQFRPARRVVRSG